MKSVNKLIDSELDLIVTYHLSCFHDFPTVDYDTDTMPISHTVQLESDYEFLQDKLGISDEDKNNFTSKSIENVILAELTITEFPSEWKEEIGESWFCWLDALDGDHAVIGSRADQIEEEELYDDPFLVGSLFYVSRLDVHPFLRGREIGIKLIQYSFRNLIRNASGMIFLISKPMQSSFSKDDAIFKSSSRLAKYYERVGFTRVSKRKSKDVLMEVTVEKLLTSSFCLGSSGNYTVSKRK
ncbi:hypothetical protein [Tumebacillus lipolyticus]|uniref:N-acetyltransferase domain-containing protein n=1 Tax=Tumebacillus lipolyticus TaxID=1280370 RepID=A0ABW5A0A3_9BACL